MKTFAISLSRLTARKSRLRTKKQLLNKLDAIREKIYSVNNELIEAGRGHETIRETLLKNDPLSVKIQNLTALEREVKQELKDRFGFSYGIE